MGFVTSSMADARYNYFGKGRECKFADIHCHCLPGLDDGPATMVESLELCRMLAGQGIAVVVATPHQLGRFDGYNEATTVREVVHRLNGSLRDNGIPLEVVPGGEVRVDERICRLLAADKVLTLSDRGRHILLELPHQVFIDIEPLLVELLSTGIQPIISHAERIAALVAQPEVLFRWLDRSAHLQITASSLLGELGPAVQETAWRFLSSGVAELVATDAHDRASRRPRLRAAFERISTKLGRDLAHQVCIENPSRVVDGQTILPVLPYNRQEVG
ncbi:MAG: tyrosine-protein phosphatase [Planctomycetota bacterium]